MMYGVIIAGLLFEAFMHSLPLLWKVRQPIALSIIITTTPASLVLLAQDFTIFHGLLLLMCAWRVLNLSRILKGRMHENYLKRATRRTSLCFITIQFALLSVMAWQFMYGFNIQITWHFVASVQLIVAFSLCAITASNIHRTRHLTNKKHYSDKELPTVTVAIPARNETSDLEACLVSVIANDYPKLEILVLDDCSQDQTADIIKKFAHDGVRFIKGKDPEERWLAKNQAYEALLNEASGDLVLFCGVDVRFGTRAIRALVTTMLNRKKAMISILPKRFYGSWKTTFIQPMRYWWELVPPRRLFNRPPVLSTCWLASKEALKHYGGFAAVSHAIMPEVYFAKKLVKSDAYSFIRADEELDVQTVKGLREQQETAIRTRYPQARRRPEMVMLITLAQLLLLFAPFVTVLWALLVGDYLVTGLSLITCILLIATHIQIMQISNPSNVPMALFNFPFVVLSELLVGFNSMLKYEFSVVDWKGRNVCIPVMHVIPKLPEVGPL